MDPGGIGGLVGAVVAAVFAAAMGYARNRARGRTIDTPQADARYQDLGRRYGAWEVFGVCLFLLLTLCGAVLWWGILSFVAELRFGMMREVRFLFHAPDDFWTLPALFLAMGTAAIVVHVVEAIQFRHERDQLKEYERQRYGWLASPAANGLGVLFLALFVLLVPVSLNWYTLFADDDIVVRRFGALASRRYTYDDIAEIHLRSVPSRRPRQEEWVYAHIQFSDGTQWSSRWLLDSTNNTAARALAAYVSRRTGIPVDEADSAAPESDGATN